MNHLESRCGSLLLASALCLAGFSVAQAAVITLHPIADSTLQEAFPNNNLGDGVSFQAGGRRQGGRTRGLLRFDIGGSVPAGATITSASLGVTVVAVPSGGFNSVFDLNRTLASWGEGNGSDHGGSPGSAGQVTWNNRLGAGTPWTSAGGDFFGTVSASRAIAGFGNYTFSSTPNLIVDVQGWLDTPANNFGWLLRSESELTTTSIRRFGSRDSGASSPLLTVEYVIPEPGTISVAALGLVVVWRRRRP